MKIMKKNLFVLSLCALLVLSFTGTAFAARAKKGGYTMKYDLYSTRIGLASGAGALTAEDSAKGGDVYAFVGIFSYKNGKCKNSTTKTQSASVTATLKGNGGKTFTSYHNLLRDNYKPIGDRLSLTK